MESNTPGSYYQPLFDLLNQEHGIIPLESEMTDIIVVVEKMRGKQPGPRWVKASERLPGWDIPVMWRLGHGPETARKIALSEMTDNRNEILKWEWYDEQPAAGREEDDVEGIEAGALLRWLNENDWSGVGSGEYINSTTGRIVKEETLYQEFKNREK